MVCTVFAGICKLSFCGEGVKCVPRCLLAARCWTRPRCQAVGWMHSSVFSLLMGRLSLTVFAMSPSLKEVFQMKAETDA